MSNFSICHSCGVVCERCVMCRRCIHNKCVCRYVKWNGKYYTKFLNKYGSEWRIYSHNGGNSFLARNWPLGGFKHSIPKEDIEYLEKNYGHLFTDNNSYMRWLEKEMCKNQNVISI